MEGKKISFGFMKSKKVEKPVVVEKREYIECLEEKSIKIVGGEQVDEVKPLVIPMKPNTLITAERLKEIAAKVESGLDDIGPEKPVEIKSEPDVSAKDLTLDQMAVRELLQEAKKEVVVNNQEFTVPIPSKPVMDGQKESTLEDYEAVPVQDFGLAMLRGMGWAPGKEQVKYKQPELRPKGLGLGANKVIADKQTKKPGNSKEEELSIVKNSYVKVIAGKHSGYYGKVVSLDEDNGRVMVDIVVKKETVSLSEFMLQPVTKAEFDKEAKVINTEAYEEYKKNERSQNKKPSKNKSPNISERNASPRTDRGASSTHNSREISKEYRKDIKDDGRRRDETSSNGRSKESTRHERSRRNSSSSEERSKRKDKYRRDSSSEDRQVRKKDKYKEDVSDKRKKDRYRRDSRSSEDRSDKRRKDRHQRDSSCEGDRRKTVDKKRYSSNDSLSSLSESEEKKKHKSKKRYNSSLSEPDTHKKAKRDIDKKRKGKKKKRDRDRSPNYKKHRK